MCAFVSIILPVLFEGVGSRCDTALLDHFDNMKSLLAALFAILFLSGGTACVGQHEELSEKLLRLTADSKWNLITSIPLKFDAHHTQGLVKVDSFFYMTAVEVTEWPKKYEKPEGKFDRDVGKGKGHVFNFDKNGNLLNDILVGAGDVYHPGGIDFDGKYIWIPVTEYRPNSFSIIYRLDPITMQLTEVTRYPESIGAIVHNTDKNTLVAANWGARKFYTWKLDKSGHVKKDIGAPDRSGVENPSFYIAFQDCKYLGNNLMLGSGHESMKNDMGTFRLGGWEIVDLKDFRARRQIPVKLWSPTGASMLNNPCAVEPTKDGIRAYFVPDDDEKATLFVYDVEVTALR